MWVVVVVMGPGPWQDASGWVVLVQGGCIGYGPIHGQMLLVGCIGCGPCHMVILHSALRRWSGQMLSNFFKTKGTALRKAT